MPNDSVRSEQVPTNDSVPPCLSLNDARNIPANSRRAGNTQCARPDPERALISLLLRANSVSVRTHVHTHTHTRVGTLLKPEADILMDETTPAVEALTVIPHFL